MSVQKIIQESINKNPLAMKEALAEELNMRICLALEAKTQDEACDKDELDEVSDKKLDAYRQAAFKDQPAGDDGSDKYRKRKFGRDLAFDKQVGRAKVLATK